MCCLCQQGPVPGSTGQLKPGQGRPCISQHCATVDPEERVPGRTLAVFAFSYCCICSMVGAWATESMGRSQTLPPSQAADHNRGCCNTTAALIYSQKLPEGNSLHGAACWRFGAQEA